MARIAKKVETESGVRFLFGEEGSVGTIETDLNELNDEIRLKLALHGLKQKLGDAYAGEKDPAAAMKAVEEVYSRLKNGEWTTGRAGGGSRVGQLAKALARVKGVSVEEAAAAIENLSKEERAQLRKHPLVQKALLEIKMEALGDVSSEEALPL